jgi:hypothetical protein
MSYRETFFVSQDGFPPTLVADFVGHFAGLGFIDDYH